MPPEVLGDEEDEQLVTYEKDWSKAATMDTQLEKRHTRYCMPAACLVQAYLLELDY
jgi:hypothetical protein